MNSYRSTLDIKYPKRVLLIGIIAILAFQNPVDAQEKNQLRFSFDRGDLWDNRVQSELKESGFTYANLQKLVKDENSEEISRMIDNTYYKPYPTKLPGVRLELEMSPNFSKAARVSRSPI